MPNGKDPEPAHPPQRNASGGLKNGISTENYSQEVDVDVSCVDQSWTVKKRGGMVDFNSPGGMEDPAGALSMTEMTPFLEKNVSITSYFKIPVYFSFFHSILNTYS